MRVIVHLFAGARQRLGRSAVAIELPEGGTVGDVRGELAALCPELVGLLDCSRIAVSSEYVPDDWIVGEGDEVALIPPVSGG